MSNPDSQTLPGARASPPKVAHPPDKPVMIFDGDCGFCRFWIERWRGWMQGRVEFVPVP